MTFCGTAAVVADAAWNGAVGKIEGDDQKFAPALVVVVVVVAADGDDCGILPGHAPEIELERGPEHVPEHVPGRVPGHDDYCRLGKNLEMPSGAPEKEGVFGSSKVGEKKLAGVKDPFPAAWKALRKRLSLVVRSYLEQSLSLSHLHLLTCERWPVETMMN